MAKQKNNAVIFRLLLAVTVAVAGLMACNKLFPPLEGEVVYSLVKPGYITSKYGQINFADNFTTDVTYTNEKGQKVTEENVSLPWSRTVRVKASAKIYIEYEHKLKPGKIFPDDYEYGVYTDCSWPGDDACLASCQLFADGYTKDILRPLYSERQCTWTLYSRQATEDWLLKFGKRYWEWDFTENNFAEATGWSSN